MPTVRQALKIIQQLSLSDINRLYRALAQQVKSSMNPTDPLIKSIRERKNEDGFLCPYCHSKHVIRFGTYNVQGVRRQRYRCCQCYKTLTDLTQTPLNKTHFPDKWLPFIEGMMDGHSLRKQAASLDLSLPTAFSWRHKILKSLERVSTGTLNGIVEMDETYFLYSEKGTKQTVRPPRKRGGHATKRGISHEQICVLVARDRQENTYTCDGARSPVNQSGR